MNLIGRIFLLAAALCSITAAKASPAVPAGGSSPCTIDASDTRITYVGRTRTDGGRVSFDWTGTFIKVRFEGNMLSFKVSDTRKNYFNVWIDSPMGSRPDKVLTVCGTDTTITIISREDLAARFSKDRKALKRPHQVILQKRTEGEQGLTTISGFISDGSFLQADPRSTRLIEYIGDSYTCGYGTEASRTERFTPETENQNLTYACEAARFFGAEQIVVAHSGMGIARNYNGNVAGYYMPERYLQTFDMDRESRWDFSVRPDITVIYLGANDFSTGMQPTRSRFVKEYARLLSEIKEHYGEDYPVLCIAPKHDPLTGEFIREAVESCGYGNVHFMALPPSIHDNLGDMGADSHPNYSGHKKIASAVIPCISTIMGWEMEDLRDQAN